MRFVSCKGVIAEIKQLLVEEWIICLFQDFFSFSASSGSL